MIGWGHIFRSQVSAIGTQVRIIRFRFGFGKSTLCPLSSTQPSIQSSPHFRWPVAAPGDWWRGFSIQPSIQSSTQSSIQSSVLGSAIRHLSSIQSSIQQSYVVTRSRPYPRQTRSARGAAPTPRPFTPAPIPGPSPSPLGLQMSGFEAPLQAQSGTFPLADC
jgi:hypothetical protein